MVDAQTGDKAPAETAMANDRPDHIGRSFAGSNPAASRARVRMDRVSKM